MARSNWADWRDEIAKACDGSHHTLETIEARIAKGELTPLFAAGCCFVVQIHDYPTERACQVEWAAGSLDEIVAALPDLCAWAKLRGCTEILEEGNPAWQRVLKAAGWDLWSVTMRKRL